MLRKLFLALTVAASTGVALSSVIVQRADNTATCQYVFVPDVPVDPTTVNLVAEFNFITGLFLAKAVSPNSIENSGSTFTEEPNGDFDIENQLSADGFTCAQTQAVMESLTGSNQEGPSGVTWFIQSSECSCDA